MKKEKQLQRHEEKVSQVQGGAKRKEELVLGQC